MPDDIQQRVLRAFQEEHREHIAAMREMFARWPELSQEDWEEAFRLAHSLKGGARVCDLGTVEQLTHHVEQLFAALVRKQRPAAPELRGEIEEVLAAVEDYMAALAQDQVPVEPSALLARWTQGAPRPKPPAPQPARETLPEINPVAEPNPPAARAPMADGLRVSASHLDQLLRSSSQLLAEATRQTRGDTAWPAITAALEDLLRLSEAEQGISPEELRSRLFAVTRQARRSLQIQRDRARTLRVLGERVQSDVRQARMVPVASVLEGYPKMVRDLARGEGKEVEFSVKGLEREADRLVLQALKDPVMHALRNAVSHGIELPSARVALGKEPHGQVRLRVEISGHRLVVRISDDGCGLNAAAIGQRAIESGLVTSEEAALLSREEIYALLFRAGFSTRRVVTEVAGRGMGLSVVREALARLQGTVRLEPALPHGTQLILEAPVTAATHRLILVRAAGAVYALPSSAVASLQRLPAAALRMVGGKAHVWVDQAPLLLASLGSVFGQADATVDTTGGHWRVAVLKSGARQLALAVDALLRGYETLVAPVPAPANRSPFFSGAVLLENGEPALVLDPGALVDFFKGGTLMQRAEAPEIRRKVRVLVVDDSFTARTLQKNILETAGYEVTVAVDGQQALAALRAHEFAAVVADVQMPRLDGFQMLEAIKRDDRLRDVPVVLMTSLSSEEDQERGLSLGARAYLIKQKFDHQELLKVVQQIV